MEQHHPGTMPARVELVKEPIDIHALIAGVRCADAGAMDVFIGTTRNNSKGRTVIALEYSAFEEMALEQMNTIAAGIRERWNVTRLAIVHRLGRVPVGEASVVIAISSPHRKEAFESCRYAIDTLKKTVPIWKKEFYEDGSAWVQGEIPGE